MFHSICEFSERRGEIEKGNPLNLYSTLELIPNILQSGIVLCGISLLMDPSPSPFNRGCGYLGCSLSSLQFLRATEMFLHSLGSKLGGREAVS